MKKILVTALALALPALASAQVQLMSGYNFGQFLGSGYPSLDGTTGDPVGSVGSNFRLNSQAPSASSGDFVGNNGLAGNYSNGFGRAYWDGTNGSSSYDSAGGVQITAVNVGPNSVNGTTVQGYSLSLQGDGGNLALKTALNGGKLGFLQNTTGFTDYVPASSIESNLTFAASVTAPVTVNWFLNGSNVSFGSTSLSGTAMTSYTVDLPTGFYGLSAAQLVAEFSGAATLDNVQFNGALAAIPEPSTYAAILGLATAGLVALRRRKIALI